MGTSLPEGSWPRKMWLSAAIEVAVIAVSAFHEKADPCQEFFLLSHDFFLFFPFSQAASVATLPSALFGERLSLGASWVSLIQ